MSAPRQMTANTLNALKGWPAPAAVDFNTIFDATLANTIVLAGAVVHVSAAGTYLLGVGNLDVMPMFMFNSSDDPDVINNGGDPATVKGVWVGINPTGQAMALVAIGSYELVSTAFDTTQPQNYGINTFLTSPVSPSANAGLLMPGTKYVNTICGIVSRGIVDNGYGVDAVAFYPLFIPHT